MVKDIPLADYQNYRACNIVICMDHKLFYKTLPLSNERHKSKEVSSPMFIYKYKLVF